MRFVHTVERFLSDTRPSPFDEARWRQRLTIGTVESALTPDVSTRAPVLDAVGSAERSAT
ncbi:Hydrolase, alpha/beta fold family functionally coupled to Phosphoribulokinase [Rhodococcus sp. WAY2]|nr:Hydrolase, alpha/beta fold family functionally coupled to Phosphoribulokinase [Rhodococcus sp. WAY2]